MKQLGNSYEAKNQGKIEGELKTLKKRLIEQQTLVEKNNLKEEVPENVFNNILPKTLRSNFGWKYIKPQTLHDVNIYSSRPSHKSTIWYLNLSYFCLLHSNYQTIVTASTSFLTKESISYQNHISKPTFSQNKITWWIVSKLNKHSWMTSMNGIISVLISDNMKNLSTW